MVPVTTNQQIVFPGNVQLDESFNWSFRRFPKKNPPTIPAVEVLESLLAWLVPSDLWGWR